MLLDKPACVQHENGSGTGAYSTVVWCVSLRASVEVLGRQELAVIWPSRWRGRDLVVVLTDPFLGRQRAPSTASTRTRRSGSWRRREEVSGRRCGRATDVEGP